MVDIEIHNDQRIAELSSKVEFAVTVTLGGNPNMKQVIIFGERRHDDLQEKINDWTATSYVANEILDIKFSTASYERGHSYCRAMIIYEKKNSN
jgi:hypothetical protein